MSEQLTQHDIKRLFNLLNEELKNQSVEGELYLVGGAVMCLVYNARPATKDVDALFQPTKKLRQAAAKVGLQAGIKGDWLNDAVKGYVSNQGKFNIFLELSHLRIFVSRPDYLL